MKVSLCAAAGVILKSRCGCDIFLAIITGYRKSAVHGPLFRAEMRRLCGAPATAEPGITAT
jgi:hypothetical protein